MTISESSISDQTPNSLYHYSQWRSRFLRTILWVLCGLGIILIGAIIPSASTAELAAFGLLYIALLVITLMPFPYGVKAGTLITIGYFIGIFTLIRFGPWSDSTIFFLANTIFATLLFDEKIDRWVAALNTISLILMSILDLNQIFKITEQGIPPLNFYDWLIYITDYIVLAVAALWSVNLLKTEFKTISEQLRSALSTLSKDRTALERRIEERTAGFIRKTEQLRAASYVAHQIAEIQDLASVLNVAVRLISDQFGFYHAGIFLMNENGNAVRLQAASSDSGKSMLEEGCSVKVGDRSVVGQVSAQKKPRIALDTEAGSAPFNNPRLPNTRSEVALPLLIRNKILGVLDIQSDQSQSFSIDDLDVLQTLADQVAVAIENTRLLDQTHAALMQLETLTTSHTRTTWEQKASEGGLTLTYTPLGLRSGKAPDVNDKALKASIALRGHKIGSITITRKNEADWSELDQDLLDKVAEQTGLAVDNLRLLEEATQRAKMEQTIGELSSRFSQSLDIDTLLQVAARELGQVPDVAEVSVFISQIPEQASQKRSLKRKPGNLVN